MNAMRMLLPLVLATACSGCDAPALGGSRDLTARPQSELVARAGAPLFEGMGHHNHVISTDDPAVQRYFDQGLVLAFGFNHAESIRSFRAAQTLDGSCVMCYWGEALATGPNINVTSNGKAVMSSEERVGG